LKLLLFHHKAKKEFMKNGRDNKGKRKLQTRDTRTQPVVKFQEG